MLTYFQAIIMGALQGVTELFPVSSLGHSVILPALLRWNIDQEAPFFLIFIVATHFATALVLLGFFIKDWIEIVKGILRSLPRIWRRIRKTDGGRSITEGDMYAKLGWLLIVATVPAGLIGLVFEHKLRTLFAAPLLASVFLGLNGVMLYFAEKLRKNAAETTAPKDETSMLTADSRLARLSWKKAFKIGVAQCLALLPGFSRTGSTLGGGLLVGLSHEDAARFSFLLATPVIFAAAALKLPQLLTSITGSFAGTGILSPVTGSSIYPLVALIAGFIAAAVTAFFSIKFLTKYFETKTLMPFARYCAIAGIVAVIILSL